MCRCPAQLSMRTLTTVLLVALSGAYLLQVSKASEMLQLCGTKLADALTLICMDRGGYHTAVRRATDSAALKSRHHIFGLKRGIVRREYGSDGVVDECCRRSCSISTLQSYCASPSATGSAALSNEIREQLNLNTAEASSAGADEQTQEESSASSQSSGSSHENEIHRVVESSEENEIRPIVGTFSRNRPFFFVVPSAFHPQDADVENTHY